MYFDALRPKTSQRKFVPASGRGFTPTPEREVLGIQCPRPVSRSVRGFTMIEAIVCIGILAVIGTATILSLLSRRSQTDLTTTAQKIAALLREAQSRSAAVEGGVAWGVYFANPTTTQPFYAIFSNVYGTSTVKGLYLLPNTVSFSAATVTSGSSTQIIFGNVSGLPAASFSVGIFVTSNPNQSSTISVATSGLVNY